MTRLKMPRSAILFAGCCLAAYWPQTAHASFAYFMEPGSMCQTEIWQTVDNGLFDKYDPFGHSVNYGAYNNCVSDCSPTYPLTCPVLSEVISSETGSAIVRLNAAVYDRNPYTDVTCTFYTFDIDGNVIWTGTQKTSNRQPAAYQLSWTPTGGGQFGGLRCEVPPNSGYGHNHVANYYVTVQL